MKYKISASLFLLIFVFSVPAFADKEKDEMKAKLEQLQKELDTVKSDRDNVLKQAKNFLKEKDEAVQKLEQANMAGSKTGVEIEAAKKEMDILRFEADKAKMARDQDAVNFKTEKGQLEQKIAQLESKISSAAVKSAEDLEQKLKETTEDRNRLEQENKSLSNRLIENQKILDESKRQMAPFELDREEIGKLRTENKEMQKRLKYIGELEKRQQQLIKENGENREKLEVLKAKFKESVPGLAKAGRISQKMMRENADMHYNLGTIFLNNKQYREAIREYEQVLELRPNDPETHYNLGVLYDDYQRDRDKALYHYQRYMTINPKAPDAKKVESYILSLELEQKVR